MNAEQFLSENYNGFFDEFDITELQDIIQAMEDYKNQALTLTDVSQQRELLEVFVKQLKEDNELTEEITFQDINKCIASNCG